MRQHNFYLFTVIKLIDSPAKMIATVSEKSFKNITFVFYRTPTLLEKWCTSRQALISAYASFMNATPGLRMFCNHELVYTLKTYKQAVYK